MSTISANDIQNTSGGIPTVKGQRLIPTAWVNFNGSVIAIRDSENVSSITDNGTGSYTVNFATVMANGNISAVGATGEGNVAGFIRVGSTSATATAINSRVSSNGVAYDDSKIYIVVIGGQ